MAEVVSTIPSIEIKNPNSSIVLKPFSLSDAPEIFKLIERNRDHLSQFGDDTAKKYPTLEAVIESIRKPRNPKRLRFSIRDLHGSFLGSINLTLDEGNPQRGEIGYYMGPEFQGKGIATEATKLLSNFAFSELGYKVLYAKVHLENKGSEKVLIKAGYQHTGTIDGDMLFILARE